MKRLFIYIATLLLFAACTSEETVTDNVAGGNVSSITAEIEDPKGIGDEFVSRASLSYDATKDVMAFKWDNDDAIGVFTYKDPSHSQQLKYTQIDDPSNTDYVRTFKTDKGEYNVATGVDYVSCFPYIENHILNYTKIPVNYLGQMQKDPVDFSDYKKSTDTKYKESQPKASAHLSKFDYLCTSVTHPTANGGIHFNLNRMGAIVRFWIVLDKKYNYVYDSIQVVNRTKQFTLKATMDAEKMTLTPTEQSHIVNLKLGTNGNLKLGTNGFDMSEVPTEQESSKFYYWNGSKHSGYIMAYMMFGPIDLKGTSENPSDPGYVENCFIYLVAHEKDHPENIHYFKSPGLSKPNLTPNAFYKWTIYPDEDKPIEVSEITVEEWREGTTFENGNGNGTATW